MSHGGLGRVASKKQEVHHGSCVGINAKGEIVRCSVVKKGSTVSLTDHQGFSHVVHPSNATSADLWAHEFQLVRNLKEAKYFPAVLGGGSSEDNYVKHLLEQHAAEPGKKDAKSP